MQKMGGACLMQLLFICREIITALSNMAQSIHLRFCPSLPSPSDTALFQGNGQLFPHTLSWTVPSQDLRLIWKQRDHLCRSNFRSPVPE